MKILSRFSTLSRVFAMTAVCVLLASCGPKVKGTYADPSGAMSFNFDGSNVTATMAGQTSPAVPYTVDGNKVKMKNAGGTDDEFTIESDGSLSGPGGMKLIKK